MQNGFVYLILLLISSILFIGIKIAIKRGGRKVKLVDPKELVIFPKGEFIERTQNFFDRFIPLEGAANFRDIGGYLTESGKRVLSGKVFRSDELSELSDTDLLTLKDIGLRFIFDLRNSREVKKKTDRIPKDAPYEYRHTPIYEKEPKKEYLPAILFKRHKLGDVLAERYFYMIEKHAEVFGKILSYFADPNNFPIVYHCNAGKDRTGIITAFILSLLGVPDETIIADYSLSNLGFEHYFGEFVEDQRHSIMGVKDEEFQGLFIVKPDWMKNLLTHLRENYGSVEKYLINKAKMDSFTIDRIRTNLLA
jgi:protein-tyrosine phosphatase